MTPFELRQQIRKNKFRSPTSGHCPGYTQVNVIIMPSRYADDFKKFCALNSQSCPLLDVTAPGDPVFRGLGRDVNVATDVPKYNIYREGVQAEQVDDLTEYWQDDHVAFALGCSHSFEDLLIAEGMRLRHIERGHVVPAFVTNVRNVPVGPFGGHLVVSMRPFVAKQAIAAIQITGNFPQVHGAPIHMGNPLEIGIDDVEQPDWGKGVGVADNEIPLFWACGVTPQEALKASGIPLYIGHAPGHMLVTDITLSDLQSNVHAL
ncbi:putative hydro-lyase [Pseudomonas sp. LB-090624]|uniref:putative hydro-lyase n=1 Tax=Pseudomonas sp. LB-090624 TaxID=2213079 RepID=UPI000D8DEFF5|nr:putative hydro-lyase [Pseudomonas sp. LB-090624]PYB78858.1 putative hydro-lyase [Pseudomonas sp. LB-090624]